MIGEHAVIQHFVPVVQLLQVHVLGQVVALPEHLLVGALGLLIKRLHGRRQTPGEPESVTFLLGEGRPLIVDRVLELGRNHQCGRQAHTHRLDPPFVRMRKPGASPARPTSPAHAAVQILPARLPVKAPSYSARRMPTRANTDKTASTIDSVSTAVKSLTNSDSTPTPTTGTIRPQ